jgi:hypothetical protein
VELENKKPIQNTIVYCKQGVIMCMKY